MERVKLKQARLRKGWSQSKAAEELGVGINSVVRWEKGTADPQPCHLQRLCDTFEAAASDLDLSNVPNRNVLPSVPKREQTEVIQDQVSLLALHNVTSCFLEIIVTWPRRNTNYHELQAQLMHVTEVSQDMNKNPDEQISRREALRGLALFPIKMCGLSVVNAVLTHPVEEILPQCAAGITACWYLRKGKELMLATSVIDAYIPTLKALTEARPLGQRKAAADLLIQCYLLKATLARHVEGSSAAIQYAELAGNYSSFAENPMLKILALRTLASIHYYANHWVVALHTAEQAQYLLETTNNGGIPKLVSSYVYAGLATYQAHNGRKQEALSSLQKAHTTFSAQSKDEHVPIWVDHNKPNLLLNDGMAHFHLGLQKDALNAFSQIESLPTKTELLRVETLIDQVMAEINRDDKPRDMDWCIDRWTEGIGGAKVLQSEQRFNEALMAYTAMRAVWPGEQRIKDLRECTEHW